jgi:hypothetical protein
MLDGGYLGHHPGHHPGHDPFDGETFEARLEGFDYASEGYSKGYSYWAYGENSPGNETLSSANTNKVAKVGPPLASGVRRKWQGFVGAGDIALGRRTGGGTSGGETVDKPPK